jgi:hypothetical protein
MRLTTGVVKDVLKAHEQYLVSFDQSGEQSENPCVWASGFFAGLFGFNVNCAPRVGTEVIVADLGRNACYILGSVPASGNVDLSGQPTLAAGGTAYGGLEHFNQKAQQAKDPAEPESYTNVPNVGGYPSADLVEGEWDLTNAMSVGMQMLRHFAILKAGDLAKIECSIIDDMVRIVSGTFKHFSAIGDYQIYNDGGRLNCVFDATNNDWELYGKEDYNEPRYDLEGQDIPEIPGKEVQKAQWRFSSYVGFLGDFINMFLTDKLELNSHSGEHTKRGGKFRTHVNEDGSLLVQSVGDIILERVCRVTVPLRKKAVDDPEGDGDESNSNLPMPSNMEPIKSWDWGASGGVEKSFYAAYQLRHYARWFSNYYSLARFHQLDSDWKVPTENEVPEPEPGSGQRDKQESDTGSQQIEVDVYATFRMFRDGSVLWMDGYENSIHMGKKGVTISSSTNLTLEAAGSINMVAGTDINALAYNSVDLTALKGGMSFRGENFIQQYSKGGILMESDSPYGAVNYDPDNPFTEQDDIERIGGVYIKSKSSVRMESGGDMGVLSKGTQYYKAGRQLFKSQAPMILNNQLLLSGNDGAVFLKGALFADRSVIEELYVGNDYKGIFGMPGHIFGDTNEEEDILGPSKHEGISSIFERLWEPMTELEDIKYTGKFVHRKKEEYKTVSNDPMSVESIFESVTQQGLALHQQNDKLNTESYSGFNIGSLVKLAGDRGAAWPGENKQIYQWRGEAHKLWKPSSTAVFENSAESPNPSPFTFMRLS